MIIQLTLCQSGGRIAFHYGTATARPVRSLASPFRPVRGILTPRSRSTARGPSVGGIMRESECHLYTTSKSNLKPEARSMVACVAGLISRAVRCYLFALVCITLLLVGRAQAQILTVGDDTSTPIEGAG